MSTNPYPFEGGRGQDQFTEGQIQSGLTPRYYPEPTQPLQQPDKSNPYEASVATAGSTAAAAASSRSSPYSHIAQASDRQPSRTAGSLESTYHKYLDKTAKAASWSLKKVENGAKKLRMKLDQRRATNNSPLPPSSSSSSPSSPYYYYSSSSADGNR